MKYANTEINFTEEHMTQIATAALHMLKANLDKYDFEEFIAEQDIDDEQLKFFGLDEEEEKEFTCSDCPYHWRDEYDEYPSCHYNGDERYAPCAYEEYEEQEEWW